MVFAEHWRHAGGDARGNIIGNRRLHYCRAPGRRFFEVGSNFGSPLPRMIWLLLDGLLVQLAVMIIDWDLLDARGRPDKFRGLIVSFLGSKPSSSDEERLEPFFSHRLTP
jgi:hypothetical protein